MKEKFSICMVTYHTGDILFEAINSALEQEGLHELVIVDNGNPDVVKEQLRSLSDANSKIRYFTGHGNVGFAAGCHLAARQVSEGKMVFMNPDLILRQTTTLLALSETMDKHKNVWMAGICLYGPKGTVEDNNTRNLLTPSVAFGEVFKAKRRADNSNRINRPLLQQEEPYVVPAISGAFMCIDKARFEQIGGIDERYFFHVEDLDLCHEIAIQGGEILFVPSLKAMHMRSSSDVSSLFVEWHKSKGFIRYFFKHYSHAMSGFFPWIMSVAIWLRFVTRLPRCVISRSLAAQKQNQPIQEKSAYVQNDV